VNISTLKCEIGFYQTLTDSSCQECKTQSTD